MSDLASNWARLVANGTNLGLFKINSFLFIFGPESNKINRKLIFKSPKFLPFGINPVQLEAKSYKADKINHVFSSGDWLICVSLPNPECNGQT